MFFVLKVAALKEESSVRASELTSLLEMAKKEAIDTKKELDQEKQSCTRKVWAPFPLLASLSPLLIHLPSI